MRLPVCGLGNSHHSRVSRPVSATASSATAALSPRQRKLAEKRKKKQQQREVAPLPGQQAPSSSRSSVTDTAGNGWQQQQQQRLHNLGDIGSSAATGAAQAHKQQQQQQQQQHRQVRNSTDTSIQQHKQRQQQHQLPVGIVSLSALTEQQQQPPSHVQQSINTLTPDQLCQLIMLWAQESRNMSVTDDVTLLEPLLECYVTAAADQLQRGKFDRQQLADVTWGLAHFDALAWRQQQQQGQQQQQQHGAPHLRWCGPFQAALSVPYLILPNLLPDLKIMDFLEEITLRQDVINLQNDKGELRSVPESRLTGWQSDIGASFCYSGKEMRPTEDKMTPRVAQVRDVVSSVLSQHYDSVLINYYADGKCGMRYHVDPLYHKWTPNSAVVSLGDTRQFVFRRIDDHSVRWSYKVSNGDVVFMFDDCQEVLQHAVKVEQTPDAAGPRISLVYKQRIKLYDGNWA